MQSVILNDPEGYVYQRIVAGEDEVWDGWNVRTDAIPPADRALVALSLFRQGVFNDFRSKASERELLLAEWSGVLASSDLALTVPDISNLGRGIKRLGAGMGTAAHFSAASMRLGIQFADKPQEIATLQQSMWTEATDATDMYVNDFVQKYQALLENGGDLIISGVRYISSARHWFNQALFNRIGSKLVPIKLVDITKEEIREGEHTKEKISPQKTYVKHGCPANHNPLNVREGEEVIIGRKPTAAGQMFKLGLALTRRVVEEYPEEYVMSLEES